MQCWLYSIRGQIIMSHYFHIKKMSIIISIVLVKFLTVVRWMYKIPLERCHKYEHNACVTRVWHAIHCGNYSLASSHQKIRWICTHKASEINDCNLLWHPSFLYDGNMLCVPGPRVLHNKHFESTLLSSNIRPILFEFRDLQYIQYNMELRYILILAKTRDNTWVVGHARLSG